jgi:hypothetical protein
MIDSLYSRPSKEVVNRLKITKEVEIYQRMRSVISEKSCPILNFGRKEGDLLLWSDSFATVPHPEGEEMRIRSLQPHQARNRRTKIWGESGPVFSRQSSKAGSSNRTIPQVPGFCGGGRAVIQT